MAARPRRRPLSREEALALQQRRQHQREMKEESRELARGPIDLPFLVLTMLLTGIGLIMLLSASFSLCLLRDRGTNPMSYFIRQGVFAIMGVAAMLLDRKDQLPAVPGPGKAPFVSGGYPAAAGC